MIEILFILFLLIILFLIGGIIIFFIKLLLRTKTPREVFKDSKSLVHDARKTGSDFYNNLIRSDGLRFKEIDEELFRKAYNEIKNSTINEGLWVKSLVLADGDEDKQETEYIKLRVIQLSKEKNESS